VGREGVLIFHHIFQEYLLAVAEKRILARLQNPQDVDPFLRIGDRRLAAQNALDEVRALGLQGLALLHLNLRGLLLVRNGHAVLPRYVVRVEQELLGPGHGVAENSHVLLSDHHERLLLERVQPGDEHMGLEPARKLKVGGGDVRDLLVEIIAAGGHDRLWLFLRQAQDHGDVVRGEAPENVFLPPDLAEAQAV